MSCMHPHSLFIILWTAFEFLDMSFIWLFIYKQDADIPGKFYFVCWYGNCSHPSVATFFFGSGLVKKPKCCFPSNKRVLGPVVTSVPTTMPCSFLFIFFYYRCIAFKFKVVYIRQASSVCLKQCLGVGTRSNTPLFSPVVWHGFALLRFHSKVVERLQRHFLHFHFLPLLKNDLECMIWQTGMQGEVMWL